MLLLILICIVSIFISFIRYKNLYNPAALFGLVWAIVLSLYSMRLVNYYDISIRGFTVLIIQIIAFEMGCLVADHYFVTIRTSRPKNKNVKYVPRLWIIYAFSIASIVILAFETGSQIQALLSGKTFYDIANENLSGENNVTGIMVLIKIFMIFPSVYAISAVSAASLLAGKKNWFLFSLNILLVAFFSMQHGARTAIIFMICCYMFAFLISSKSKTMNKRIRRCIIIFSITSVFVISWLTQMRGVDGIFMHIYKYLVCNVPLMDYWVNELSTSGVRMWGLISFSGLIYPFFIICNAIGILPYPQMVLQSREIIASIEDSIMVGPSTSTNAFVGPSFAFFADYGYVGVFIGLFIFGYIATRVFKNIQKTENERNSAFCLVFLEIIAISFTRYPFMSYSYGMMLPLLMFVFYKKEKDVDSPRNTGDRDGGNAHAMGIKRIYQLQNAKNEYSKQKSP